MAELTIVGGKGQQHTGCICTDNIDLQSGRCAVTHGANGEFVKENACSYCYAKYIFKDNYQIKPSITTDDLLKDIKRREKQKLKDDDSSKTVKHIRLGKMVDIWDNKNPDQSKETLMSVLHACNELMLPVMAMTKLLPFDEDIALLLLLNKDSVLHYSLGDDTLERGAVLQGFTNEKRIEEAIKYKNAGCNIYLRLVADVVQPMTAEHQRIEQIGIPLLVTPLRYSTKELFALNTKLEWDEAAKHGYKYDRGSQRPQTIHTSWGDKYKHAYCGVVGDELGCNACGLYQGRKKWIKE